MVEKTEITLFLYKKVQIVITNFRIIVAHLKEKKTVSQKCFHLIDIMNSYILLSLNALVPGKYSSDVKMSSLNRC